MSNCKGSVRLRLKLRSSKTLRTQAHNLRPGPPKQLHALEPKILCLCRSFLNGTASPTKLHHNKCIIIVITITPVIIVIIIATIVNFRACALSPAAATWILDPGRRGHGVPRPGAAAAAPLSEVRGNRIWGCYRRTPHPVIVTRRDNKDYIRVLFYSYNTTITGWGVLLRDSH